MHVDISYRILISKKYSKIGGRAAHMTKDERIANFKYNVLQDAQEHENITLTCKVFQITRTIYYDWSKQFIKFGHLGLQDKKKAKPMMPNQIKPDKEQIILNYI